MEECGAGTEIKKYSKCYEAEGRKREWPVNYKIIMLDAAGDGWTGGSGLKISRSDVDYETYRVGDDSGFLNECVELLEEYPNV